MIQLAARLRRCPICAILYMVYTVGFFYHMISFSLKYETKDFPNLNKNINSSLLLYNILEIHKFDINKNL